MSQRLRMPRVLLIDSWKLVQLEVRCHRTEDKKKTLLNQLISDLQDIICTINTQHECERHNCQNTAFRFVFQERTKTSHKVPVVEHRGSLDQFILNTGQMRDAKHVQKLRIPSQPLDFDTTVHESAAKAVDVWKVASTLLGGGSNKKTRTTIPLLRARGRASRGRLGQGQSSVE